MSQIQLDTQQAFIPCPNTPTFDGTGVPTFFAACLTVFQDIAASLRRIADAVTPVEPELVGTDYIAAIFILPGLLKITRVTKPARKAGKKPNPFKPGEMMEVKARPAHNVVKVRPLKKLKEMV